MTLPGYRAARVTLSLLPLLAYTLKLSWGLGGSPYTMVFVVRRLGLALGQHNDVAIRQSRPDVVLDNE